MNLLILTAATLLVPLAPQDPQAPQDPGNRILEGVAVQAGEKLVTLSEYQRLIERARAAEPQSTREGEERQRLGALRELWMSRLEAQAGAELGIDPAQIDRISRAERDKARDREGLEAYLAELEQQGKDAMAEEGDQRGKILRYMWREAALGRSIADKRTKRDQGMRPGELRAIYEENKHELAPVTVQLRWLIVSSEASGGPEAALAICEDARVRVQAGEDLALFVEEHGADFRESRGLTPLVPPRKFLHPELVAFAEKAEIGDLSPVLALLNPKTGKPDPALGYQLAEMHERNVPEVPPFTNPDVQRTLRGYFKNRRDEMVLERERDRLRRESYSWVNPLVAPPPRPAPAAPPR
jgi:hypothetical protein